MEKVKNCHNNINNSIDNFNFINEFLEFKWNPTDDESDRKKRNYHSIRYSYVTSHSYLKSKYGKRKTTKIEDFISCLHEKINTDVNFNRRTKNNKRQKAVKDEVLNATNKTVSAMGDDTKDDAEQSEYVIKWNKIKLFLILTLLSERGGPEYWCDDRSIEEGRLEDLEQSKKQRDNSSIPGKEVRNSTLESSDLIDDKRRLTKHGNDGELGKPSLTELIIKKNINKSYSENPLKPTDVNYVFSSIWANFMEGLINHYMETRIIPQVEKEISFHLFMPMMETIAYYKEYRNNEEEEGEDNISHDKIPNTICEKFKQLGDLYNSLINDEQDSQLDDFVYCAEEYTETIYIPHLINMLFENIELGNPCVWEVLEVLEPFFYYIEDCAEEDEDYQAMENYTKHTKKGKSNNTKDYGNTYNKNNGEGVLDPRLYAIEKICTIANQEQWF
ncbi:uncharacterized protein SCODWIG_03836 [Saccharomycodes ludwigii]|uniref:Uncharacterized protein n=1 Tax=Saccharomycodes ludwigii TaxID=36035 RepID=A0A376BBZ6_9ASCO|nr:hypothetical protein SCDLUD_004064 [Saccharomycodes ludwigii]KAH3899775.1 hypothetical protein SCDLUD_004064 [Saccharomycodes ludwigii]SSD62074.1 uncharacterized protein SCODWIG_03836 [Saccharomycodes ludwigii]